MDENDRKIRISNGEGACMVAVGAFADFVGLIPVIGGILALVFGTGILGLWFLLRGVGFVGARKFASAGLNLLGEAVSVGYWPGFTLGTILMLAIVRAEDKTGISIPKPGKKVSGGRSPRAKFERRMEMDPARRKEMVIRAQRLRKRRDAEINVRGKTPLQNTIPAPKEA